VDFVAVGNAEKMVSILGDVYTDPPTIAESKAELESGDITQFGRRTLTMADNQGKGWLAILLGKAVDHHTVIPDYILKAIFFAYPTVTKGMWVHILGYRVRCNEQGGLFTPEVIAAFRARLEDYRKGTIDFTDIRNEMLAAFTADPINHILEPF
jgi:putative ATP-dependent endonuclease of OLD family